MIGVKAWEWWCAALIVAVTGGVFGKGNEAQTFEVKGVVVIAPGEGKTIVIRHEAISNYMAAMTMPFEVKDTNELRGLQAGDAVAFRMVVTPKEGWIEAVTKLNRAPEAAPREMIHFGPAVAELSEGDLLPNYRFTNELGRAVEWQEFRGQTLALTFFFTSCPYPNFCPRMTGEFCGGGGKTAGPGGGAVASVFDFI